MRINFARANSRAPFAGWWFEVHMIRNPELMYLTLRLFDRRFHRSWGDNMTPRKTQ